MRPDLPQPTQDTSLNTPSDVEKESIDDFAKIMDDASETILKKQLPTTTVLVDHLRALQMVLYVNAAADNKNLLKVYSVIFKTARAAIATDMETDVRPIDSTRFAIHKLNLDTALLSAGYQEIAPPLSAVHVRAMAVLATSVSLQQTWSYTAKLSASVDSGHRCQTQGGLHRSARCAQGRT